MTNPLFEDSLLFSANAPFIEELYEAYLLDSQSVPQEWHEYFDKLQQTAGGRAKSDVSRSRVADSFVRPGEKLSRAHEAAVPPTGQDEYGLTAERKQISVLQIINAYRFLGVRQANLDPLKHQEKSHVPELDPGYYGLTEADMSTVFGTGSLIGPPRAPLGEILQILQQHG